VFAASSNPISTGIVADLSLPGSNVTSLSLMAPDATCRCPEQATGLSVIDWNACKRRETLRKEGEERGVLTQQTRQ